MAAEPVLPLPEGEGYSGLVELDLSSVAGGSEFSLPYRIGLTCIDLGGLLPI